MCTCSEGLTRRQAMLAVAGAAAAFAAGSIPLGWAHAADADGKRKKVLFFTKSAGFQHSVVTRKGDELAHAEKIFAGLGKKHGFDVTVTKDGSVFTPEKLAEFDVVAFYTTGDLTEAGTDKSTPMPKGGKEALLDFVRKGKGFVGFHCASDTFHSQGEKVDPYIRMVGAEFKSHGSQQEARIYPAPNGAFAPIKEIKEFKLLEEWYEFKNFNPDMHVILVQDTQSMKEKQYTGQPAYPQTWARKEGQGRVFYTSLGHREDVWTNELFHGILLGGLSWAAGNVEADVPGNFKEATPGAMQRAIKEGTA